MPLRCWKYECNKMTLKKNCGFDWSDLDCCLEKKHSQTTIRKFKMCYSHMGEFYGKDIHQLTKKNIIDKERSNFLVSTGTTSTDIAKILKARRIIATRCTKENKLANMLEEPYDDNVIVNASKGDLDCYKNLGEFHSHGLLRSKGIKVEQNCVCIMSRMMKGTFPLGMKPT